MLVTQDMESTVSFWGKDDLWNSLQCILKGMHVELYRCRHAVDSFMIPNFVLILDGRVLRLKDPNIDTWECYLSGWSGKRERCKDCNHIQECGTADAGSELDDMPDYRPPIILLNQDKMKRQVECLVSLIPPFPTTIPLSNDLSLWIQSEIKSCYSKVQRWAKEYNQWVALNLLREVNKPKKAVDIAKERWLFKDMVIQFPAPDPQD